MFYIYILYSSTSNIYYVGYSSDPHRRLEEHNNPIRTKFTSKHLPWELKTMFAISENRADAMKVERIIKKKKSRSFIEQLISSEDERTKLIQLVRVPNERD